MPPDTIIVVAALNEADHIGATLAALARAFPGAALYVADDGSTDATSVLASAAGATVIRSERVIGKGEAMTAGVEAAMRRHYVDTFAAPPRARARPRGHSHLDSSAPRRPDPRASAVSGASGASAVSGASATTGTSAVSGASAAAEAETVVILCDGDLGESAALLGPLADVVRSDPAVAVAVAAFTRRVGGGFGLALGFARFAIRRRCGLQARAPISGQRALRARVLHDVLPFASGFGMEIGITIDAVRAGHRVVEIDLDLAHRATGRTLAGFAHRARQLIDFVRVYRARR